MRIVKNRPFLSFILTFCFYASIAQVEKPDKTMELYGFIMADAGYDFGKIDPNWFDVMRPAKILNSSGNEFQPQGNYFMSIRKTRLGLRNYFNTGMGTLKTNFEFDLFGSGADAGKTTFRLRHAFAELGKFGFGQTNSVFMDIDIFPNCIEFLGPNGMAFFRNIQIRYTAVQKENERISIALERPGASADEGEYGKGFQYANLLSGVSFRFFLPDLTAEYRKSADWGYVELAGILRSIHWEDANKGQFDFSGSSMGWGLNLSTNIKLGPKATFKGSVTGGAGIQNYMNGADADIGIKRQYTNNRTPISGVAIPVIGCVGFLDLKWSEKFSSSAGYSRLDNRTTESQLSTSYKSGQYALVNVLYYPAKNCLLGAELQWGSRRNNNFGGDPVFNLPPANGNQGTDLKLQLSFKYSFSQNFYSNK